MSSRRASISKKSTIIIQYFLGFCDPTEEFFQNIRLVSKPWKHAIETMKYEELDCSFWERLQTHGGKFPPFLKKYLQMFQELIILIPNSVSEEWNFFEHWDSLRPLILNNSKKLSLIQIVELEEHTPYHYPQNFNEFLCTLTKNSQNTLNILLTSYNFLPPFPLPNVEEYGVSIGFSRPDDAFSGFVGRTEELPMDAEKIEGIIAKAKKLLPNLEKISLGSWDLGMRYEDNGLNDSIIKVMTQKYKNNLCADPIFHKVDFLPPKVLRFQYPQSNFSMLFDIKIMDIDFPQETLQNPFFWYIKFEFFIEGCTKLEIVIFHEKDFWSCNSPNFSEEEKIIWKQLFLLLKSRGVTLYFEDKDRQFYEIDYKKFKAEHDIDWKFKFQI